MKIKYRPEIDGLRAIAIVSVILYHSQITIFGHKSFEGGFIGVDIFFVISGYLITSIILKELITTGYFSFKHFYQRRIRRILPTLLVVLLVSLPFAWMYLLPSSFVDFSKSILYSLGFISNFYFYYSGQVYNNESGLLKPFLHTWSLSVEEQYYILFPIFFLIVFKYFKKYLIHILILSFSISLALAEWFSKNYSSFNFYVLPTRGWELLAGSILAYFEFRLGYRSKPQGFKLMLPSVGFFLIGIHIVFFNKEMSHPSFSTLPPIIGACLIIWFSHKDEIITKILSTKLFVAIGLISYSLYLWHFPIFAFARITGLIEKFFFINYLLIILTILISILSYFLIENKFRDKNFKFSKVLSIVITLYFFYFIILTSVILNKGFKKRFNEIFNKIDEEGQIYYLLKNEKNQPCLDYFNCSFNNKSKKKVFLLGDSHMAAISFDLNQKLINRDYQFIPLTIRSCYFFRNFDQIDIKSKKKIFRCTSSEIEKRYDLIKKNSNSIIILGGMLAQELSGIRYKEFMNGDKKKFSEYKSEVSDNIKSSFVESMLDLSRNNQVILVYPYPEISFSLPKKITHKYFLEKKSFKKILEEQFLYEPYNNYLERSSEAFELLNSIKSDNVYRVFPHKLICGNIIKDGCVTHNYSEIFYSDFHHPSSRASELINELIMKEILQIELKFNK